MKQQRTIQPRRPGAFTMSGVLALALGAMAPPLPAQVAPALEASKQAVNDTAASQARIDKLDDQAQTLLNDYRANLKQLEQLRRYNESQRRQVEAQEKELASLRLDIDNISGLQRSVQPLMGDMLDGLERLVAADLPFLPAERQARVTRLRGLMDDPDKSPAQRYRLIVEAYQIENEYGRTIEAYRGDVTVGETTYENVELLRVGRVALFFKTDDDQVLKRYDPASGEWRDLDRGYLDDIKTGLRMAREQIPPDLLPVPLPAPHDATNAGESS